MRRVIGLTLAAVVVGASPAAAQETQAPTGSELAEPYNPFDTEPGTADTQQQPELFEVPQPTVEPEVNPQTQVPAPTSPMLAPDAGVQPLDLPESPAVTPQPPLPSIDESMLQGSPVDIPSRDQVVPTPESTREQVHGVTN